jgi:hypothetical protein
MVDRLDIDALLVGALYGELTPADEARLTAHLESHPGDRNALDDLKVARQAVRDSRIFELQLDPPQAVSALLLQEAARRAPKRARSHADNEGWFARLARSFMAHPAMAAATMLVLVLGVASTLYLKKGDEQFAEKTVSSPNATPAVATQDPQAAEQDRQRKEAEQQLALEEGKLATERAAGSAAANYAQPPQGSAFAVGLADKPEDTGVEHRIDGDALERGGKANTNLRAPDVATTPKLEPPTTKVKKPVADTRAKPENIDSIDGRFETVDDTTIAGTKTPARHTAPKGMKKGLTVDTPEPAPKELASETQEAKPTTVTVTKSAGKRDDVYAPSETDNRPAADAPVHAGTGSGASTGSVAGPSGGAGGGAGASQPQPGFAQAPTARPQQPGRAPATSAPQASPPPPAPSPAPATAPKPPADTKTVAKTDAKPTDKSPPPPPTKAAPAKDQDAAKAEKPAAKAGETKNTEDVARAKSEHARAVSLAGAGKCPDAAKLLSNLSAYAPNYYAQYVATDRALKQCMAYINDQREKEAEKASKSRSPKRVNADEPSLNSH